MALRPFTWVCLCPGEAPWRWVLCGAVGAASNRVRGSPVGIFVESETCDGLKRTRFASVRHN